MLFSQCMPFLVAFSLIITTINSVPVPSALRREQAQHLIQHIPANTQHFQNVQERQRRQIDLNISAEHNDKDDETELALEAIAGLWRSPSGKTSIEGSAKVVHRSNSVQSGNTSYSARLHLHHDYKK